MISDLLKWWPEDTIFQLEVDYMALDKATDIIYTSFEKSRTVIECVPEPKDIEVC